MFIALAALVLGLGAPAKCSAESYRPLDHLWEGTRDVPNTESLVVLGTGTALTVGALALDSSVHDYFRGRDRLGGWAKIGNEWVGTGIVPASLGLVAIGYGLLAPAEHELNAGEAGLEGLLATGIYTELFKATVRRTRPESDSTTSFPSGHTSNAFSAAATTLDMYGWWAGAPALALAAYTGVCRLDVNVHHLSDVLFGAALGFAVGHAYTLHHRAVEREKTVAVEPYFDSRSDWGLVARLAF